MIILPKDCFFNEKPNGIRLDDMTEEQWTKCLSKYYEKYKEIFGYVPNEKDYYCTREIYAEALLKALEEKKDISEYLKNN